MAKCCQNLTHFGAEAVAVKSYIAMMPLFSRSDSLHTPLPWTTAGQLEVRTFSLQQALQEHLDVIVHEKAIFGRVFTHPQVRPLPPVVSSCCFGCRLLPSCLRAACTLIPFCFVLLTLVVAGCSIAPHCMLPRTRTVAFEQSIPWSEPVTCHASSHPRGYRRPWTQWRCECWRRRWHPSLRRP